MALETIGKALPRVDAFDKVTGSATYTGDVRLPRMLHGKVLTSPVSHARILSIDASRALKLPGVRAVVTRDDTAGIRIGGILRDQTVLATDKVRFQGEYVAAVAATDPDIAEEALRLINVEYDELPAVFDPVEAMGPYAPIIHEELASYKSDIKAARFGNVCAHVKLHHGNLEQGWAEADLVLEEVFRTPPVHAGYIEPHTSIASAEPSGDITVWSTAKGPYRMRLELSQALQLPMSRLRVITPYLGGDFGGKGSTNLEPLAALLSRKSGHPVKVEMSRRLEFSCVHPRHPSITEVKLGIKNDGTLVALEGRVIWDAGAYADTGPRVVGKTCALQGAYRIPHVRIGGYCVYTNKTSFGNVRAPGSPQMFFAIESLLDMAALRLGIDPVELRLKNAVVDGDTSCTGQRIRMPMARKTLEEAAKASDWRNGAGTDSVGWGAACGEWHSSTGPSSVAIKLNEDGTAVVFTGAVEQGGGVHTILTQIVSEVLTIPVSDITRTYSDTATTPYEGATGASRQTFNAGTTALKAARELERQLLERGAEALEANAADLELAEGQVRVKGSPDRAVAIRALVMMKSKGPLLATAAHDPKAPPVDRSYSEGIGGGSVLGRTYTTQIAQVAVDRETGDVRVLRYAAAQDVGRAMNPMGVEGQIHGGVACGLGFALSEQIEFRAGATCNDTLMDYRMPTAVDVPNIEPLIIEEPDEDGPFGAKSAGELPTVPVAGVVANAIQDAVGVRITDLPITPEKILRALKHRP